MTAIALQTIRVVSGLFAQQSAGIKPICWCVGWEFEPMNAYPLDNRFLRDTLSMDLASRPLLVHLNPTLTKTEEFELVVGFSQQGSHCLVCKIRLMKGRARPANPNQVRSRGSFARTYDHRSGPAAIGSIGRSFQPERIHRIVPRR